MIRFWAILILLLFALLLSGNLVSLYTDWLWFIEIGQLPILITHLTAELKLGLALKDLFFIVLYLNLL